MNGVPGMDATHIVSHHTAQVGTCKGRNEGGNDGGIGGGTLDLGDALVVTKNVKG